MISSLCKNLFWVIWWTFVLAGSIILNLWAVLEHYLSATAALELAGTDRKPLMADTLVGQFLGLFVPEATLPHAIALTMASLETLGLYMLFHVLLELVELAGLRAESVHAGNDAQAREATRRILRGSGLLALGTALLYGGIRWDMELFRFRSLAAAGAEFPDTGALLPVGVDPAFLADAANLAHLADLGAWGYMAFTAVGCLVLEWSFLKLGESFTLLMHPIDQLLDDWASGAQRPVQDASAGPRAPVAAQSVPPPVSESVEQGADQREAANVRTEPAGRDPGDVHEGRAARDEEPSAPPPFDPPEAERPLRPVSPGPVPAAVRGPISERYPVLGGTPGEKVTLAAALADRDRYVVDHGSGRVQVWDRRYREQLLGVPPKAGEAAA